MPDRDVFDRRAPKGWASPLRHLCGRSEADIVAAKAVRSLTKTLRTRGGIPGAASVIRLLEEYSSGEIPLRTALTRLRRAEQTMGDHTVAALGIRAAQQILCRMEHEPGSIRDVPLALYSQFCLTVTENSLFGCASDLIGDRFPDVRELREFVSKVVGEMMPSIDRIAQQLEKDATAQTLTHPRSVGRRTRRKTGEMLHQPLT